MKSENSRRFFRRLDNAGKVFWVILLIVAIVAIGGVVFVVSGAASRFVHSTFDSPKKYFSYVVKEELVGDKIETVSKLVEQRHFITEFKDQALDEKITLTIGERGEKYLRMLRESEGVDLSWISTATLKYNLNSKDKATEMKSSLLINDKEILNPNVYIDYNKKVAYAQVPELTKSAAKVDFGEYLENESLERLFERYELLSSAYPGTKEMNALLDKYLTLVLNEIDNVEKEKNVSFDCDEVSQKCTRLTATLKEKDLKKIQRALFKELAKDKDLEKILKNYFEKIIETNGLEQIDADEVYDRFLESLEEAEEEIDEYESDFDKIIVELYLNGSGNVIGQIYTIVPKDGDKAVFKFGAATSGKEMGVEFSYKCGEESYKFSGTGRLKGTKLTSEFMLKVNGEKILKASVEDFDIAALAKGNLKGHCTASLISEGGESADQRNYSNGIDYMLGRNFRVISSVKPGIDVVFDVTGKKHSIDIGFMSDDEDIFRIAIQGTVKNPSKVKFPEKAVDVTDEDELDEFLEELNWEGLIDALDNADAPKSIRDAISEFSEEGFSLTGGYLEKSRKAKDEQILSGWNMAAISAYVSEASSLSPREVYVITIYGDEVIIKGENDGYGAEGLKQLSRSFYELSGLTEQGCHFSDKMYSKSGRDIDHVEITIDGDNGLIRTKAYTKHPEKYYFDEIRNQ